MPKTERQHCEDVVKEFFDGLGKTTRFAPDYLADIIERERLRAKADYIEKLAIELKKKGMLP